MMSEHRYGVHDCPNGFYYLRDVTDHSVYVDKNYGYLYSPYKEDIELVSALLNGLADKVDKQQATIQSLKEENEQLRKTIKEVIELLLGEVDLFSDKATEHDIIAYKEMNEFDNKDAYYMCVSTKKAIKLLQRCL